MKDAFIPFLLCLFAGLSTGIGSIIAILTKSTNRVFMSLTLGFSAGVMIYVSLAEILAKARDALAAERGLSWGTLLSVAFFFGGIVLIALIGKLIPSFEGEACERSIASARSSSKGGLLRTGLFSAFAIAIHNFPEGMATFVSALKDPAVAIPVVVAIAIHNIPEGIAVAAPVYRATSSRRLAFLISFLSGLAEPVGAIVGWLILLPFMSDTVYGMIFAASAGIMVYISADEILPSAESNGRHSYTVLGFVLGMAVMALSLWLFI